MAPSHRHRFAASDINTAIELQWIPIRRSPRQRLKSIIMRSIWGGVPADAPESKVNEAIFEEAVAMFARHDIASAKAAFNSLGYRVTIQKIKDSEETP